MSNYCGDCRYDVSKRVGETACPVNTLYWDFLARHRERFASHPRMRLMTKHLDTMPADELVQIRSRAESIRSGIAVDTEFAPLY